jgi:hypothetical protein
MLCPVKKRKRKRKRKENSWMETHDSEDDRHSGGLHQPDYSIYDGAA